MHIKQITISNFRSFRQQGEIQPFLPGMNAVVGRNGSGKSNLFDAVQFCLLAPRFASLRQEERRALLHEGSGSVAVNAFVEIVFDNSDQRFVSESTSDEVVLRRTIGLKKDEFFLQRQRTTKQEVQSMLEQAGFSKSNPYYIVQQGKVQDLCTMSEEARLRLLMEVAGTTVYDQKKTESNAKMLENKSSIEKISDILGDIQTRLDELQAEKEELTQYQALDRQRRALEYSLYDKEWQKARNLLEQIEEDRANHTQYLSQLDEQAKQSNDKIKEMEALVTERVTARQRNQRFLRNYQEDLRSFLQEIAKKELAHQELKESLQAETAEQKSTEQHLRTLEKDIAAAEQNLQSNLEPAWNQAVQDLESTKTEKAAVDQKIKGLYAKQGRGRHFATVQDRDAFLQKRIDELESQRVDQDQNVKQEQERLAHLRRSLQDMDKEKTTVAGQLQKHQHDLEGLTKTLDEKKRAQTESQEERKKVWRQREGLHDQVREARETVRRAKEDLRKTTPRATSLGLDALSTIVEQEGLVRGEHYFGPVMENFKLRDPKYQTAVEVAAQNALFHVIVDTDETASRLLRRLEEGRLGRVTFLPLEQLRIEKSNLPTNNADVKPLMEHCLEYDPRVDRALRHVFGKKLLCRTLDLATDWSAKLGVDGITLDGDLCSRKGSMTGGYIDATKSRLRAFTGMQAASGTLYELEEKNREVEDQAKSTEQKLTVLMQEVSRLGAKQAQLGNLVTQKDAQVERIDQRKLQTTKSIETLEKTTLPPLERDLATLEKEVERLREEIGTELVETLAEADRDLLEQLKSAQVDLETAIQEQSDAANKLAIDRQKAQSNLHDNLYRRRRELVEGAKRAGGDTDRSGRPSFSASIAQKKEELEELERDIVEAKRHKEQIQAQYDKTRSEDEKLQEEEIKVRNDLEHLRAQDEEYAKKFDDAKERTDRLLVKRTTYISKRETYMRKIQELGSLPPPAELEKFSNKTISDLMKTLDHVNKKLKAYSHVNKKAFDQYVNFNEQRDSLLKRKEELDQGAAKVEELIENLDRQKDEAINRTFRDVSKHFKDVFHELVPNGEGELILKTAMDEEMQDEDDDESEKEGREPDVRLYRGVGIKVRFAAAGETYMMSQLSGGQKALVALCIIFSIQRCDPAPFYLFDELDQALDSTYRSAVADLIKKQSKSHDNPTQFIVSTFRPELVDRSERWFGISHQNKVSSLHGLSKKDSLSFIANLMDEEEAVGEVTSLAVSKGSRRSLGSRKRKGGSEGGEEATTTTSSKARTGRLSAPV